MNYFLKGSILKEVPEIPRYIKNKIKAVTHLGSRIEDESPVKS